ncbi:MAG: hypothetical protein JXB32_08790 [Deltaproteobacteria bacterium]|nr:hypothetical protein [Deltaproteobacteria bacterium]
MSRGSALLTLRPFLLAALAAVPLACRSAVAPPSPPPDRTAGLPSGMVETTPGARLESDCPRRECPLPANLIADLEEKMVERLGKERTGFLDGFVLLEAQRSAFVAELRAVTVRRGAAPPSAAGQEFAVEIAAARAAVAGPLDAVLAETLAWLEPDVSFGAPSGAEEPESPGASPSHGGSRPAPAGAVAHAQDAAPREGHWILPLVRMMARLRGRFAGVSSAQGAAEALFRALRAAERRLHRALEALPPTAADAAESPTAVAPRGASRPNPVSEEQRRVAALVEARNAVRDEAEADLRRLLDALERSRPATCRPDVGSVVCRPAPVDVWTGSEFTLLQPDAPPLEGEPLLEVLDRFLGDSP